MKILKHREHVEHTAYSQCFYYHGSIGHGFSFPCNEKGEIDVASLKPASRENLRKCFSGENNTYYHGIEETTHSYFDPAEGECPCGETVILSGFTNTCDSCLRDFNMSGQELAHRSQWGEETGEHLSDILNIP